MADVVDKSKQTNGVPKFHRVTVAIAGQSAALDLPSATRDVVVQYTGAGVARLFLSAADEIAGTGYVEVPPGVAPALYPMRTPILIVQATGAGIATVVSTHDALHTNDIAGEDYVAA